MLTGIYIHIPFCKSKCPYCDFHSGVCNINLKEQYTKALINEINTLERLQEFTDNVKICADTLYIGGGTPSVLTGADIEKIVFAAKEKFYMPENSEITIECNPGSPIEELIPYFKNCGINRVSLGLQSAVENERKLLGRSSNKQRVKEVVTLLQKNGIENISLDVMLGIPEQTESSLKETLDFVLDCNIPHISTYILKIEDGTFFDKQRERYSFPTDDDCASFYEFTCRYLEDNGFSHYEISNFSKKGFESRHNTKYWQLENYLGIGASAHSYFNKKRFYFPNNTEGFIKGEKPVFDTYGGDYEEYIMLRLRLKRGLNLKELKLSYPETDLEKLKSKAEFFVKQGVMLFENDNISLNTKGMLISNYIISELL